MIETILPLGGRLGYGIAHSLKLSAVAQMSLPLRGKGDRYPLGVVVDEVFFGICNILLKYTSSVTRFYCLTQFLTLWCVPPSP